MTGSLRIWKDVLLLQRSEDITVDRSPSPRLIFYLGRLTGSERLERPELATLLEIEGLYHGRIFIRRGDP